MRVAALDLGTNTFILLIADVIDGRIERVLHDEVRVIRLGQGVHENRAFHPEALVRAESCFSDFGRVMKEYSVERVLACATSAARDVTNGEELLALGRKHGIPIQIIGGEKEAEFTFWGTVESSLDRPVAIVDVGGGSTEFILGDGTGIKIRKSIDIGAVRLTEMFVTAHPISQQEMMNLAAYIRNKLRDVQDMFPSEAASKLIAVAGTPTTLAAIDLAAEFDVSRIEGYSLSLSAIRNWVHRLAEMSVQERQALAGMEPKRADVIVAGSLILMLACEGFRFDGIEVSTRGLRYGVAKFLSRVSDVGSGEKGVLS